jgi:hypothetical protein
VQLSDHHRYRHTLVLMLVGVNPVWPPELWHRAKRWPHARRRDPARPHVDRTALIGQVRRDSGSALIAGAGPASRLIRRQAARRHTRPNSPHTSHNAFVPLLFSPRIPATARRPERWVMTKVDILEGVIAGRAIEASCKTLNLQGSHEAARRSLVRRVEGLNNPLFLLNVGYSVF